MRGLAGSTAGYDGVVWTIITILGIIAAVVIAVVLAKSRPPRRTDPHVQPPVEDATHGELPDPGTDEVPRRPDGSVMPGSEQHRNRRGRR